MDKEEYFCKQLNRNLPLDDYVMILAIPFRVILLLQVTGNVYTSNILFPNHYVAKLESPQ
jgi:hypothetical protein